MMLVDPNIMSCALGGLEDGFVPWYNASNLLKRYIQLAICHWDINING